MQSWLVMCGRVLSFHPYSLGLFMSILWLLDKKMLPHLQTHYSYLGFNIVWCLCVLVIQYLVFGFVVWALSLVLCILSHRRVELQSAFCVIVYALGISGFD